MRKIKVAIIGAGQIAQTTHIPAFKSMENVEIVGVSDTYENVAGKQISLSNCNGCIRQRMSRNVRKATCNFL